MYNEGQLVEELRNGSHVAFRQLFDCYKGRIYAFLFSLLRSHDEAEELLQNVFVKLWEARERLDKSLSLNAYIYKIAKNDALNYMRQKAYRIALEREFLTKNSNADEDLELSLIGKDLEKYVNSLIDDIPSRRREIFLLKYRQKMSYKEIAMQLGISENTVDTQLRKALGFLRDKLGKELLQVILMLVFLPF